MLQFFGSILYILGTIKSLRRIDLGVVYFDWNRDLHGLSYCSAKTNKILIQTLKLEHPAEHMQESHSFMIETWIIVQLSQVLDNAWKYNNGPVSHQQRPEIVHVFTTNRSCFHIRNHKRISKSRRRVAVNLRNSGFLLWKQSTRLAHCGSPRDPKQPASTTWAKEIGPKILDSATWTKSIQHSHN